MHADMNHFVIGMAIPFAVAMAVYAWRRGQASWTWLLLTPIAMAVFAFLAVIPDLPRLAGRQELYMQLASEPWTNVFLWHYTLDQVELDSQAYFFAAALPPLVLLVIAWRTLSTIERK